MSIDRNPFRPLEQQFEQLQRQFEQMLDMWGGEGVDLQEMGMSTSRVGVDLVDKGDEFVLTADLPGYERDNIELRVTDDTVHLTAERQEEAHEEEEGLYLKSERHRKTVTRQIQLQEPVDEDHVEARYQNGVLTVIMPKREPEELDGETIDIQ